MKRRVCSMMLALALCLGMLPGTVLAEEALPDNAEDAAELEMPQEEESDLTTAVFPGMEDAAGVPLPLSAPFGWEEDENGNVTISTADALIWLSAQVNGQNGEAQNYHGKVITLAADIDLSGVDWTPIGNSGSTQFKGSFDGGGHTVSNMTIQASGEGHRFGFFGDVSHDDPYLQLSRSPFIRDLNLKNISIRAENLTENLNFSTKNNFIGGLVGEYVSKIDLDPRPFISGCSVSGSISCSGYKIQAGGLVGHAVGATDEDYSVDVINCSAAVDISGTAQYAGGFVGLCEWKVEMLSCSASGNLEISNGESTGGFVGSLSLIGAEKIRIRNCYATGNVQLDTNGSQVQAGGFCGEAYGGTTSPVYYGCIQECMCSGDVTLTGNGTMLLAGGFLGSATPPGLEVSDCYCTGDVTVSGGTYALGGGFAGNNSSVINRCYASGSVTGTDGDGLSRAFGFSGNGTTS